MQTKTTSTTALKAATLTFNKNNGSGENVRMRFYANGSFELYPGEWFRLVAKADYFGVYSVNSRTAEVQMTAKSLWDGEEYDKAYTNVYPLSKGDWASEDCGYTYYAEDPRIAAAQFLFNTI